MLPLKHIQRGHQRLRLRLHQFVIPSEFDGVDCAELLKYRRATRRHGTRQYPYVSFRGRLDCVSGKES
jgi:hypothetical protein